MRLALIITVVGAGLILLAPYPRAQAQWLPERLEQAVADTADREVSPQVAATSDGGYCVAWIVEGTTSSIRLQRYDLFGTEQWTHHGIELATATAFGAVRLAVDPTDRAVVAFDDSRFGGNPTQVTVLKVDPDGTFPWGTNGVQLGDTSGSATVHALEPLADGRVAVLLTQQPAAGSPQVEAHQLAADGSDAWEEPFLLGAPPAGYALPCGIVESDREAVIVLWQMVDVSATLVAQKISVDGVAQWGTSPVPVYDATAALVNDPPPLIGSDGNHGAVICWSVSPPAQCLVQRLDSRGTEVFAHNGLPASLDPTHTRTAAGAAYNPETEDTYLFWVETNGASEDAVYGQMFDYEGERQWGDYGAAVTPFSPITIGELVTLPFKLDMPYPTVPDTLLVWQTEHDTRTANSTLQVAAVDGSGAVTWPFGPVYACARTDEKTGLAVARTRYHSAAVAWTDTRNELEDVYTQQVYVNGGLPAPNAIISNAQGEQGTPKIRQTPDGGHYISWFGDYYAGSDLYLQRYDAAGSEQWAHSGLLVLDRDFSYTEKYGLGVDSAGNAYLAVRDGRFPPYCRVTVMKVAPDGTLLWGANGVQVGGLTGNASGIRLAVTSDDEVVVAWQQDPGNDLSELRFQRLTPDGTPLWTTGGIVFSAPLPDGRFFLADLAPSDAGAVIASFNMATPEGPWDFHQDLWAVKLSAAGTPRWGAEPLVVYESPDYKIPMAFHPDVIPDGQGGALFCWYLIPPWGTFAEVRVQHVLADGTELFGHNGVLSSTNAGHDQVVPDAAYDPVTGALTVFYVDVTPATELTPTLRALHVQRHGADGTRLFGADGITLTPLKESPMALVHAVQLGNRSAALWGEQVDANTNVTLSAVGVLPDGSYAWPERTPVVSSILAWEYKSHPQVAPATDGGFVAVWTDTRYGLSDIIGQRVNSDGTLGLPWCWADYDGDEDVDYDDHSLLLAAFGAIQGTDGNYCALADQDRDGDVDCDDWYAFAAAWTEAGTPTPPAECDCTLWGDYDCDDDVDLEDYTSFAECLAGPKFLPTTSPARCLAVFDDDDDADVDLRDFAEFQSALAGE